MKVTIIYDNEAWQPGLEAAWGFSCLVEANGQRLLFDTGGRGAILLQNLETLNLDPGSISEIFISHGHWDHLGGLAELLGLNRDVRVYLPWFCSRLPEAQEVISVREPLEISEKFFSRGVARRGAVPRGQDREGSRGDLRLFPPRGGNHPEGRLPVWASLGPDWRPARVPGI
jgi:metal-dependent hydrolase (beta-lactamase superfamily II)